MTASRDGAAWLAGLRAGVARRLRGQRATQAALAAHVGITPKHLSQVLSGRASPGPELAGKIGSGRSIVRLTDGRTDPENSRVTPPLSRLLRRPWQPGGQALP